MTNFIEIPELTLQGDIGTGDTTVVVSGAYRYDGTIITEADFGGSGAIVYATLDPKTDRQESIACEWVSNVAGVMTMTVTRALSGVSPYGTGGTAYSHSSGSAFIFANSAALFNKLAAKDNDEDITGDWTVPTPATNNSIVPKEYVDDEVTDLDATVVHVTGDESIDGVKTFIEPVVVPDAVAMDEATNLGQLDDVDATAVHTTGNESVAGIKTFTSSPKVPDATAADEPYTKGQHDADAEASSAVASPTVRGTAKLDTAADNVLDPVVLTATADRKRVLNALVVTDIIFGGDGSDGVLNVSSGTTTLDISSKTVFQYTSVTIAVGATLTFSGGTDGDKVPVIKCQGDFINNGTITTVGKGVVGGSGGASGSYGSTATSGGDGNAPLTPFVDTTIPDAGNLGTGGVSVISGSPTAGVGGASSPKNSTYFIPYALNGASGAGGGGGAGANVGTPGSGSDGGAGSLGLTIEVVGNFTNTGSITLNGQAGTAGVNGTGNGSNSWGSGAGGGGRRGSCWFPYDWAQGDIHKLWDNYNSWWSWWSWWLCHKHWWRGRCRVFWWWWWWRFCRSICI